MKRLSFLSSITLTFLLVLTVSSCGGGGSSTSSPTPPPSGGGNPSTPPVTTVFTETNTPDLGAFMIIMTEGVVEVSELIESELMWLYHAPAELFVRNCPNGGEVRWILNSTSKITNSGQVVFDNCSLFDNANFSGSGTTIIDAIVEIEYSITQFSEKLVDTNQNIIQDFSVSMTSNEFSVRDEIEPGLVPLQFEMMSTASQVYLDNNEQYLRNAGKTKNLTIQEFSILYGGDQFESIKNALLTQYESPTANENGKEYELIINGNYINDIYNVDSVLEGTVTMDSITDSTNYRYRDVLGNFFINQGEEYIAASFNDELITLSSSSGFYGEALTYEIVDQLLYRLIDNYLMYREKQKHTPFKLVSISPSNLQILETTGEITFSFNKDLAAIPVLRLSHPIGWLFPPEESIVEENQLSFNINQLGTVKDALNFDDVDLFLLNFDVEARHHSPRVYMSDTYGFVTADKGSIVMLDKHITRISSLNDGNLVGYSANPNTTGIYKFDAEGDEIQSLTLEQSHSNLCVNKNDNSLYFTIIESGTNYEQYIVKFNENLEKESEWYLDYKFMYSVDCYDQFITYYDVSPRPTMDSDNAFHILNFDSDEVSFLGADSLSNRPSKAIDKNSLNRVFSLNNTSFDVENSDYRDVFEVIESDYSVSPSNQSVLPLNKDMLVVNEYINGNLSYSDYSIKSSFDNRLFFYNNVIDLTNNTVEYKFDNLHTDGTAEIFRFLDDGNLIATSKAVYDFQTYQKLFDLPYINKEIPDYNWFIDSQNRLNILISSNVLYQSIPLSDN